MTNDDLTDVLNDLIDALQQDLPANIRTVVERQAEGAKRNHDLVKGLRDRFDAAV